MEQRSLSTVKNAIAASRGAAEPDAVAALLKAGADPGHLLGFVVEHKNERLLRVMMQAGVEMNHLEADRWDPRFFSLAKWPAGLALLLEHDANPETEGRTGFTVLMLAIHMEYWPSVDLLLAHGARTDDGAHRLSLRKLVSEKIEQ
ncbi:MAG TPA: hypothetical protein VFF05_09920, partial [Rudaea sp.]|nr:hypothetical protein [Rudaea sp.]